jgi:hypothetical protein
MNRNSIVLILIRLLTIVVVLSLDKGVIVKPIFSPLEKPTPLSFIEALAQPTVLLFPTPAPETPGPTPSLPLIATPLTPFPTQPTPAPFVWFSTRVIEGSLLVQYMPVGWIPCSDFNLGLYHGTNEQVTMHFATLSFENREKLATACQGG